jgi:hypothetical protein
MKKIRNSEFGIRNFRSIPYCFAEGPGNPNPPAAAEADQASSEEGGYEPPAGDGATRRPEADSKSKIQNPKSGRWAA